MDLSFVNGSLSIVIDMSKIDPTKSYNFVHVHDKLNEQDVKKLKARAVEVKEKIAGFKPVSELTAKEYNRLCYWRKEIKKVEKKLESNGLHFELTEN